MTNTTNMTLRDFLAGRALVGLLAVAVLTSGCSPSDTDEPAGRPQPEGRAADVPPPPPPPPPPLLTPEATKAKKLAIEQITKAGGVVYNDGLGVSFDPYDSDHGMVFDPRKPAPNVDVALTHLKGLPNLKELNLGHTKLSDAGLAHLEGLSNLRELDLSKTEISDSGLAQLKGLTNLRRLDLRFCDRITDAGVTHLKGLTRLESLDLRITEVTNAGGRELQKALPDCPSILWGSSRPGYVR